VRVDAIFRAAVLRVRDCEPQPDHSPQGIDGKTYSDKELQNHFERLSGWNFDPDYHLLLFRTKPMQSGAINSAVSRAWVEATKGALTAALPPSLGKVRASRAAINQ
jgi:hypothetical protein